MPRAFVRDLRARARSTGDERVPAARRRGRPPSRRRGRTGRAPPGRRRGRPRASDRRPVARPAGRRPPPRSCSGAPRAARSAPRARRSPCGHPPLEMRPERRLRDRTSSGTARAPASYRAAARTWPRPTSSRRAPRRRRGRPGAGSRPSPSTLLRTISPSHGVIEPEARAPATTAGATRASSGRRQPLEQLHRRRQRVRGGPRGRGARRRRERPRCRGRERRRDRIVGGRPGCGVRAARIALHHEAYNAGHSSVPGVPASLWRGRRGRIGEGDGVRPASARPSEGRSRPRDAGRPRSARARSPAFPAAVRR